MHFLLVEELLPTLRSSAPSRVVMVSSTSHWKNAIAQNADGSVAHEHSFNTPVERRVVQYQHSLGYANSKACNVMHAMELDESEQANGVRAVSLHPGTIATQIGRDVGLIGWGMQNCNCC